MFDWTSFLDSNNIEYSEQGSDNISLRDCPYCGSEGRQYHLAISTKGKGWHCWRSQYRGRSPHKLVMDLLGCSFVEAQRIVSSGNERSVTTEDSFADTMKRKLGVMINSTHTLTKLKFLDEFLPIRNVGLCKKLVFPYLNGRGYSDNDILELSHRYNLQFTTKGIFAYRIIIPVVMHDELVNWTGRTVVTSEDLRYKTLSTDVEKCYKQGLPVAIRNIKDCLFDYDNVRKGGKTLVICEGPFDAIKVNFYGGSSIRATCLFGVSSVTDLQLELLRLVFDKYSKFVVVFDVGEGVKSFSMFPDYLECTQKNLPSGYKDPGELDFDGFRQLFGIN